MTHRHLLGSLTLAMIVLASPALRPAAPATLQIRLLDLPAAAGSVAPQLTVTDDRAVLSWIENEEVKDGTRSTLKFSERTPSGWSRARVVSSGDDWFVNVADVPSVVRLDEGTLAAHWLRTTDAENEGYDLLLSFSRDEGRTWTPPASPHHDGTLTQHGFASLFQMPGAGLGIVWLDGRAVKAEGNMTVRAAAFDRKGVQMSEALIDDRVCECCPTAVAVTADGPIAVYRDRGATEIRDIAVSRLVGGHWTAPKTVHDDRWTITACPVNGPAVSARGRQVAVAWMTAKGEDGLAFAAFSSDAGASFGAPIRLDDQGTLGKVGITLLDDGSAIASWIEFADRHAQLRVRRIVPSGERGAAQTVGLEGDRPSGYPRMSRRGQEILFAWTEAHDGHPRMRTAVASLGSKP